MKLGFACKYLNADLQQPYPFKSPTRKRFLSLDQDKRRELLLSCASHNLSQLAHIFSELAQLPRQLRMMRIGSDLLPLFTVPEAQEPYQSLLPDLLPLFAHAGALAKKRISGCRFIRASIRFWLRKRRRWWTGRWWTLSIMRCAPDCWVMAVSFRISRSISI